MIKRLVDLLSAWAVQRRAVILVLCAFVALGFGLQLPHLRVDTSPEALVTSIAGQKESSALFKRHFGRAESQLLLIIRAADVTTLPLLRYQWELERRLHRLPVVAHLDSLTGQTLPAELSDPPSPEELAHVMQAGRSPAPDSAAVDRAIFEEIVEADSASFASGVDGLLLALSSSPEAPRLTGEAPDDDLWRRYQKALRHAKWLSPTLLSHDRSAAVMVVHFDSSHAYDQKSRIQALSDVRSASAEIRLPRGAQLQWGGAPVLREEILHKLDEDRLFLNPAMALVCLLVLGLTFRFWPAVVGPISAVGIAALCVIGSMALIDWPLTILTNIIPPLLIIVGLSDSVHLIARYQEELRLRADRLVAGRQAARAMLVACFLTSLTTAVGFASLASAKTPELRTFGVVAAAGVLFAYVATVFFVPAFITLFAPPARWLKSTGKKAVGPIERGVFVVTRAVLRRAKGVAIATAVVGIGLGFAASRVVVDDRLLDIFEPHEEVVRTTHLLEEKLSGIRPLEVLLTTPDGSLLEPEILHHVEQMTAWASVDRDVIAASSYVMPLRETRASVTRNEANRKLPFASLEHARALLEVARSARGEGKNKQPRNQFLSNDERAARLTLFLKDSGVKRSLEFISEFDKKMKDGLAGFPQLKILYLGEAYTGSVGRDHVLRDLLWGLGLALVIIFLLLVVLFRSLAVGLIALPPNVIPLLATAAYMMARGVQLNLTTVITFSIGIGLAVDDTVHVVARFQEERARLSSVQVALLRAARGTGRAIFVTALSLAAGFSVLMGSAFVSVAQFGELIVVTVINCLLGALLIQPALLSLVYRSKQRKGRPVADLKVG